MKLGFVVILAACSARAPAPPESAPRMADPPEVAQTPPPRDAGIVPILDAATRDAATPPPPMDAPMRDAAPPDAFPFSPDAGP